MAISLTDHDAQWKARPPFVFVSFHAEGLGAPMEALGRAWGQLRVLTKKLGFDVVFL
jgi:hypothetical protein